MDNQQAKFILQSYQPDSAAPPDGQTVEALEYIKNDSQLCDWFTEEQALDAVLREKLAEVRAPSDLRARLLAAQPVVTPARVIAWPARLALAAAIVFLLGLVWFRPFARRDTEFASYRLQMVETLYRPITFEFRSPQPVELRSWVAAHSHLGPVTIPPSLTKLPGLGCRTLDYNGHAAVVLCFLTAEQRAVHLFVLSAHGIRHQLRAWAEFAAVGAFQTASWAEGDLVYVLAGSGDQKSLKDLLVREVALARCSLSL